MGQDVEKERKPPFPWLKAWGLAPGDAFYFVEEPGVYYLWERGGRLLSSEGGRAALSENDVWERFESLRRAPAADFYRAREKRREEGWARRGQPDSRALEELVRGFAREYCLFYERGRWRALCGQQEETLRRMAAGTLRLLPGVEKMGRRERQARLEGIYRDMVLAKSAPPPGKNGGPAAK